MKESVALLLLAVVGAVLVDSGLAKLGKARLVRDAMVRQGLPRWIAGLAGVLPWAELALASLLVLPATRMLGATLAAGVFAAFASYLGWIWVSRPGESCACFGNSAAVTLRHVILDLALCIAAVALATVTVATQPVVPAIVTATTICAGAVGCRVWRTRGYGPGRERLSHRTARSPSNVPPSS